jgi:DNA-binding MarR family transcriptional regulator
LNERQDRLVEYSIQILSLLFYSSPLNVNKIIKGTKSDRSFVIKLIKRLQREGLIEPNKASHKYLKLKQLTNLGLELARIIDNIKKYNKSYAELRDKRKEMDRLILSAGNGNALKSILREKDLQPEEIDSFCNSASGACLLDYVSIGHIMVALMTVYADLKLSYTITKTAKAILDTIISETVNRQVSVMIRDLGGKDPVSILPNIYEDGRPDSRDNLLLQFPEKVAEYHVFSNSFINREAKELFSHMFALIRTSYFDIEMDFQLEKIKNDILACEKDIRVASDSDEVKRLKIRLSDLQHLSGFYESQYSRLRESA